MDRQLTEPVRHRSAIPHAPIGSYPTAVEEFDELGAELGVDRLVVKRDDRTAGAYGGNKVRKLEFVLADARQRGIEDVWTLGSLGSNHVLATSIYARKLGLEPHVVQFPETIDDHVRETLRALVTTDPHLELVADAETAFAIADEREQQFRDRSPPPYYYIPPGGSTPVGELGYVDAALELREQIEAGRAPTPDTVVVPVGSGGTMAGLVCGCRLAGLDVDLVGVRTAMESFGNAERIAALATETAELLGDAGGVDPPTFAADDVEIRHEFVGDGYGEPTAAGARCSELCAAHGLELDPTFTAKTVAAIADHPGIGSGTVLYWHTLSSADLSDRISRGRLDELPPAYRERFGW